MMMLSKLKVKYIQSLGQKKFRDEESVFIVEGPKIVAEIISQPNVKIAALYATTGWLKENEEIVPALQAVEITEEELSRISSLSTPNQVLAIVKQFAPEVIDVTKGIVLALDSLQDPGNLGTIIRICDWFGVKHIVCGHGCADMYNPKVVQATMGSISRVNVVYTDLEEWLSVNADVPVYAAALDGKPVTECEKLNNGVVLIGNESRGIDPALFTRVKERITISRKGNAESLNAAIATGIILSHLT